jgi:UDP-N-acetylmuramyl pentapeptide phosphotransferase/UDP-N-acetylglucosamine-1-phosphate transferase
MVMFGFAAFVSYRFYVRLGIDTINFWPFAGNISLGPIFPVFVFFFTVGIVNAINITD